MSGWKCRALAAWFAPTPRFSLHGHAAAPSCAPGLLRESLRGEARPWHHEPLHSAAACSAATFSSASRWTRKSMDEKLSPTRCVNCPAAGADAANESDHDDEGDVVEAGGAGGAAL